MSTPPEFIADQLLADFDTIRPALSYDVIVELRRRVELLKFNDPTRALYIAESAYLAATALAEPRALALAAWTKGTALLFAGQPANAITCYRHADDLYGELLLPVEQVSVQAPLVYALNAIGDKTAALALANAVEQQCEILGEVAHRALAHLQMNLGTIRKQEGAFQASLVACDRAKALFYKLDDSEAVARVEMNRANVLQEMDRFHEAATAYAAARPPLLASGRNQQQVALIDFNLGLLAERRGRFVEALHHLETAHDGFTTHLYKAAANLNRAMIYNRLNLPGEAQQLAEAARQHFADHEMRLDEGHALLIGGIALKQMGRLEQATDQLNAAIDHFERQHAAFWTATANLTRIELILTALAVTGQDQSVKVALLRTELHLHELAIIEQQADDANWPTVAVDARRLHAHGLLLHHRLGAVLPSSLSSSELGDPILLLEEAIELATAYHLTAHQFANYQLLAQARQQRGEIRLAWQAYQAAIVLLERTRATLSIDELQLGYLTDKASIYNDAAALLLSADQQAAQNKNTHGRLLYLYTQAATMPLPHATTAEHMPTDRQTKALQDEITRLQELRHWQLRKITEPISNDAQEKVDLEATRALLTTVESQLADCTRRLHIRRLHQQEADNGEGPGTSRPDEQQQQFPTPDEAAPTFYRAIQQQLAPQEALIIYAKNGTEYQVLLLRSDQHENNSHLFSISNEGNVQKLIDAWRFHIHDHQLIAQSPTLAKPMARRLLTAFYQALIAPFAHAITDCTTLNLVLPPPLHDLPVAAFWNEGYLIERYQLQYLTTPAALLSSPNKMILPAYHTTGLKSCPTNEKPPQRLRIPDQRLRALLTGSRWFQPSVLTVGQQYHKMAKPLSRANPTAIETALIIGNSQAGRLPQTVHEANALAKQLATMNVVHTLIEEEATAARFLELAPETDLIHIAAHAHFASAGPLFSAIHLADRELTLLELYHRAFLKKQPFVILSTCVSGQGQARGGGLLGLARAFFAAGAGHLVVTAWQVDDHAMATLMADFYQQWLTNPAQPTAAQALTLAQRQAAKTAHPFYWAGCLYVRG